MTIEQQLEKARIWAYWSFIGFVVPVAGLIASAVSLSILNRISADQVDADVIEEHESIRQLANTGKALSTMFIVVTLIGAFFVSMAVGDAVSKAQSAIPANPYVSQEVK